MFPGGETKITRPCSWWFNVCFPFHRTLRATSGRAVEVRQSERKQTTTGVFFKDQHHGWPRGRENKTLAAVFEANSSPGKASQKGNRKARHYFQNVSDMHYFDFYILHVNQFLWFSWIQPNGSKRKTGSGYRDFSCGTDGPLHTLIWFVVFFPNFYFLEFV